jgi:hypothetical protein
MDLVEVVRRLKAEKQQLNRDNAVLIKEVSSIRFNRYQYH